MPFLLPRPAAIDFFYKTSTKTKEVSMPFCPKDPRMPYIWVQILDPPMPYIPRREYVIIRDLKTENNSYLFTYQ